MFKRLVEKISGKIELSVHEIYWLLGIQIFLLTLLVTFIYFGINGKLFLFLSLYSIIISGISRKVKEKVILYFTLSILIFPAGIFLIVLLYSALSGDFSGYIYWFISITLLVGDYFVVYSFSIKNRKEIEGTLSGLNDSTLKVYDIIRNTDRVFQYKIVEKTGFSKAKVSRILNTLKKRGVIEIERKGMGNKIRKKKI